MNQKMTLCLIVQKTIKRTTYLKFILMKVNNFNKDIQKFYINPENFKEFPIYMKFNELMLIKKEIIFIGSTLIIIEPFNLANIKYCLYYLDP